MVQEQNNQEDKISSRLESESKNIEELQERWDVALEKLYSYFNIEKFTDSDENMKLREIETKTLSEVDKDVKPMIFGFSGPGGAGKGTVREQIKGPLGVADIVNSTTRERRDYEIDGVHYNFVSTKELAQDTVLTKDSLQKIGEILNLEIRPEVLQKEHLDDIQNLIDKKFKEGKIEDGIDLFPDTEVKSNKYLNLTLRPLRGWYALSIEDLKGVTQKNTYSSFEESAPNMLRIGEGIKAQGLNFYLVYVLPEQPIAKTMAKRALKRDGVDQETEKLFSTIGGRQILEFEKMVDMLVSGKYLTKVLLLVNDEGFEKDGQFITRTGEALISVIK